MGIGGIRPEGNSLFDQLNNFAENPSGVLGSRFATDDVTKTKRHEIAQAVSNFLEENKPQLMELGLGSKTDLSYNRPEFKVIENVHKLEQLVDASADPALKSRVHKTVEEIVKQMKEKIQNNYPELKDTLPKNFFK